MASYSQEEEAGPRGHRPQDTWELCEQKGKASEARTGAMRADGDSCHHGGAGVELHGPADRHMGTALAQAALQACASRCPVPVPGEPCPPSGQKD